MKHICVFCERHLEQVGPDDKTDHPGQSHGGGQVRFTFGYGSTKYDSLVHRDPVTGPPYHQVELIPGKKSSIGTLIGSEPNRDILDDPKSTRDIKLACCSHIIGDVCDDCFTAKARLLTGWEQNKDTQKLDLLVE